jgi:hypothetical protein
MTTTHSGPPVRGKDMYYTLSDGRRLLSVTTGIERGIPKPGLQYWYANTVARTAIESIARLARLRGKAARQEAYDWLRGSPNTTKEAAGDRGTLIHNVAESTILGTPMAPVDPAEQPYVDAFLEFYKREQPKYEATELVVANLDDEWCGTLDAALLLTRLAARYPHIPWLQGNVAGDYKTSNDVWGEAGLQLSAYRRATHAWLKDGTPVEPPKTLGGVVIHLKPETVVQRARGPVTVGYGDTGYRVVPMDTSDAMYEAFLAAHRTARKWTDAVKKNAVGEPFEPSEAA